MLWHNAEHGPLLAACEIGIKVDGRLAMAVQYVCVMPVIIGGPMALSAGGIHVSVWQPKFHGRLKLWLLLHVDKS